MRATRVMFAASSWAAVGVQAKLTSALATTNLVPANVCRRDLHGSRNLFRGAEKVVDARRGLVRALHDHARQHRRERRAALDSGGPRSDALPAAVDRHRLRAHVRGAD